MLQKTVNNIKFLKSPATNRVYRVLCRLDKGFKVESTEGQTFIVTDNSFNLFLPIFDDMGLGIKPYLQEDDIEMPFYIQE